MQEVKKGKLISSGTIDGPVMKEVANFNSLKPKKGKLIESGEIGNYEPGAYFDINQTVEKYNSDYEEADKTYLLSEDSKKNRLTEIEQEMNQEKEKQKKIVSTPLDQSPMGPGNDIQRRADISASSERIKALANEKKRLQADLQPSTSEERNDVLENSGMDFMQNGKISEYDLIQKYGARYNRIKSDAIIERMDILKKEKIKDPKTENILSYANSIHGEIPKLKHTDEKAVDELWNQIKADPSYNKLNYAEKRKLIDKKASEFISSLDIQTAEGANPPDKVDLKNRIIGNLLPKFAQGEDGQPSIEGIKLYLEDQLEEVQTMLSYQQKSLIEAGFNPENIALTDEKDANQFAALSGSHGKKNVDAWYFNTQQEIQRLKNTERELDRLLKMPEYQGGFRDIGKAVRTIDVRALASMGVKDMGNAMQLSNITKKIEEGVALSYPEKKQIETFATLNFIKNLDVEGTGYKVSSGIINMVPYIAQFVLSGGAYTGVKSGVLAAAKAGAKKGMAAKAIKIGTKKYTMADLGARALGSAAQTAVVPQMYIKNISDYARDKVSLITDPELNKLTADVEFGSGMGIGKAIARGYWDAYSEMFTERMGTHIMSSLGKAGKVMGKMKGTQVLKNTALAGFMETKGIKTVAELATRAKKAAGWDGLMEEYMEEFVNYYMSGIASPKDLKGPGSKQWWSDQWTTFLTVAGFSGIVMKPMQVGIQQTIGKNIKFTGKYDNGTDFSVKMPRQFVNQIADVFDNNPGFIGEKGSNEIDKVFTQWEGKLDKKQWEFAVSHVISLGQEKVNQAIVEKTTDGSFLDQLNANSDVVQPSSKLAQDNLLNLTKEEREKIEEENKRVTELHPELAKNNLLVEDPESGQKLDPDKNTTKKLLAQVNQLIADNVEMDKMGNPTNLTAQGKQLLAQRDALEEYEQKFINEKTPFEELSVADKFDTLRHNIKAGKELTGSTAYVTDRRFEIKLDDGRKVFAYYDTRLDSKTKAAVDKAIIDNKPVSLKLTGWEEWNPDLKITDKNGVPYYDKVDVLLDGKIIGSVEVTNFRAEKSKEIKKEEVAKKVTEIVSKLPEADKSEEIKAKIADFEKKRDKELNDISQSYSETKSRQEKSVADARAKGMSEFAIDPLTKSLGITEGIIWSKQFDIKQKYDAEIEKLNKLLQNPSEKAAQAWENLKRIYEERKKNSKNMGFAFDPYSEAEKDVEFMKALVEWLYSVGVRTLEEVKEAVMRATKFVLSDEHAQVILDKVNQFRKSGGNKINDQNKEEVLKTFLDSLNNTDWKDLPIIEAIDIIFLGIDRAEDLSVADKAFMKKFITENQTKIVNAISKQKLKASGLSKKGGVLSLNDLVMPESEGPAISGAQKVDSFLNGYSPIWRSIANELDTSKDNIEKAFLTIASTMEFQNTVQNDSQYRHYITTLRGKDIVTDKLADMLDKSTFDSARSLFNVYSSFHLTRQYGFLVQKKGMSMKLLNPPERYDDFVLKFWSAIKRYGDKGEIGYKAIYKRIIRHVEERDDRFNTFKNKTYVWYESQTPEIQEQLRREQHAADVLLLSELSGIPTTVWADYFTEQTKETFAKMTIEATDRTNFRTYDNLLKHDTFRGNYHRIQSDIAFNLSLLPGKYPVDAEFEDAFVNFFTRGNEETGTLSNLYKLSTASKEINDISLRGVDIKGDRFSSLVQSSMITTLSSKIRNLSIGNDLTAFYFDREKDAEIFILNGMHNTDEEVDPAKPKKNTSKKGTPSMDMSFEDVWIAQLFEFFQEGDSYKAWMGQFGDKPTLQFIEAPKYKLPAKDSADWNEFIKDNPGFEDAAQWILTEFLAYNETLFSYVLPSFSSFSSLLTPEERKVARREARLNIAREFVYNFSKNIKDIIEVFHGETSAYEDDLVAIVKRGRSTDSPGIQLNTNVEGGLGEDYQFALVNDELIAKDELFDGVEFMTGSYAGRAQVSMGTTLSRETQPGMEVLSSMKALHTNINPDNNLRGLTKGNIINIDLLAATFPGSKFEDIKEFMKDNGVDRLSFTSTTKLYEHANGKKAKKAIAIQLWDANGKKIKNPVIPNNAIAKRKTSDTYIQQDLRHDVVPKSAKMSSQILANMLILPHGKVISELLNSMQNITIDEMMSEFKDKPLTEAKIDWLKENVNQNTQADLYRLLEMGVTPYEPSLINFMRKIIASQVTRKALEIPINRVTTQEIPDPQGLLQGRRLTADGKHVLLPEISANVQGARYAETDFVGKPIEAINHVKMNHDKYRDLFDMNDNLREWEITERNGEIPGEMIISTRTPADDLHSHTVGRLKYNIIGGNFTMLDRESQKRSGSDFDGDQRFNWVFFKDKHGKIPLFSTKEGIANQIMMQIAQDYMDPEMSAKIEEAINTKMYDDLVNKLRQGQEKYSILDPRAHNRAREENMTGVRMKGIMTDVVTIYSIINSKNIPFKKQVQLQYGVAEQKLSGMDRERLGELEDIDPEEENADEIAAIKAAQDRIPKIGDVVTMTFQEELNDVRVKILEIKKKNDDDYLVRVQNLKNEKEYSYHVDHSGEGELVYFEKNGFGLPPGVDENYIRSLYVPKSKKTTAVMPAYINLTGIVSDPKGLMKIHLANLLNMAFDNASDPKIEIMGLNEITAFMYVTAMFGDKSVNTSDHKSIHDHIAKVSAYFTSPLVRDFVSLMRRDNGGLRSSDMDDIKIQLKNNYPAADVKTLTDFFTDAKELAQVRRFYALTQKAPNSVVEFQTDKQLYRKVKANRKTENQFQFLDVKNLFNDTGHPIQEFAISEKVLRISEDIIYHDSFEYSAAGREIYEAVYKELTAKEKNHNYFSQDELKSLSAGMSAIAAIRAIGNKQTYESLEKELLSNLKTYKEAYPTNVFLQTIGKVKRKGRNYIEILPDYQRGSIGDTKLAEIRNSFDILWERNPELADKFITYSLLRWGPTTSTWRGSYYNLAGDNYRVDLSHKMQAELSAWQKNELSQNEKLQITEWMLRNSRQPLFREMSTVNPSMPTSYDYNSMATIDFSVSYDTLAGIEQISTNDGFFEYAKGQEFDAEALLNYAQKQPGSPKTKLWARQAVASFNAKAKRLFPTNTKSDLTIKDMMPSDAIGEILAIEDEPLNTFIFQQLKKMYPGVQIFTDHQKFVDFVNKFGDRGFIVDPEALGHAFANAIYIDPAKAVQSTMFHEHSHIYWDALPEDNKTKTALRNLFAEQFTYGSVDDLDEQIILEIGRAGVDIANVQLNGNLLDKFVQLLKQFWIDVETMFGIANRGDLVNKLAWRIWENSDKIVPNTNYGSALMRNMVSFNNKAENVSFLGDTHTHFIGKDPIPSVTTVILGFQEEKFDPDAKSKAMMHKFKEEYHAITREKLSQQHMDQIIAREMKLWDDMSEKGTVMHAVMESVFGERIMTEDERNQFEDVNVFYDLVAEAEALKKHYEQLYPGIIWHTEPHLISKKYKIGGFADLVGDIGNNELILFDFKTTEYEYANEDMTPTDRYKKAYALFKPPFQTLPQSKYNIHMLQTNMYANMLEEQEDPNQPGVRNKVIDKGIRIIPIIRELSENGKIKSAKLGNNLARIPRTDKTTAMAELMMSQNYALREDFSTVYPEFRANLEKSGIARQMITPTLVAYNFFRQMVPNLKDMTRDHLESIRGTEFGALKTRLFSLGFTSKDLYGSNAIPFEFLFFNASKEGLNLTRDEFMKNMDTYFPEQEVRAKYTAVLNPAATERRWSHKFIDERDLYLHEVGYETMKEGDEILMIYDIKSPAGDTIQDHYYYTVESVNKKKKTATVKNQQTGNTTVIPIPGERSGALRIYDVMPTTDSKGIPIAPVGKDSYVPRYLYQKEVTEKQRHIDFDKIPGEKSELQRTEAEESKRKRGIREVWSFFDSVPTMGEAELWAEDANKVDTLYLRLGLIDEKIAGTLINFVREVSTNHAFANQIARENNYTGVPTQPLPVTLNTYLMLTNDQDAIWKDWDNMKGLRFALPQGLVEGQYVPLTLFTTLAEYGQRSYQEEKYLLNRIMEKYNDRIDFSLATITTEDGEIYWRTPGEKALNSDAVAREFLETIYDYYERLDPARAIDKENGIRQRIPVANVFLTRNEAIEKWGKKWGPVLYDRLKPQAYDSVKLSIMEYNKDGELVEAKDKLGNPSVLTLADIKQSFALANMDEAQLREFLGPKWKHIMLRLPGTVTVAGQAGLLNYYIKKAKDIYTGNIDKNNVGTILQQDKKNIPVIGHGRSNYSMKNLVAAERKAIDSMLFRHHMKHLMAPLDWMIYSYKDNRKGIDKHITDYLKTWGEYVLYGIKPKEPIFGGEHVSDVVDLANKMNSYNKIMFGVSGQIMNFAIGQGFDVIREPEAYASGIKRLFGTGKDGKPGFIKAWHLAKRLNLANIVDDAEFDQLEKEYRVAGMDLKKIEDWGYKLMEYAEKGNQFPIFVGLMTDTEWDSYDMNAEVIDDVNQLTEYRKTLITGRVQSIHGHYSTISMAPLFITNLGKAGMAFRKWWPAYIWSQIAPYHIDKNLMVRSGILPTIHLMGKIVKYNHLSVQEKQDLRDKIINGKKQTDSEFFRTTQEYFDTLIEEFNGNRITLKNLPENEKKNLFYAVGQVAFLIVSNLIMMALIGGSDDPNKYKKFAIRNMIPLFRRFQGDILWLYNADNWQYFIDNLIPAVNMLVNGIKLGVDIKRYLASAINPALTPQAVYLKDTILASKGTPKFLIDFTYVMPGGSGARWVMGKVNTQIRKNQMIDLAEMGVSQDNLNKLGIEDGMISRFEIEENAFKYGKVYKIMKLAAERDALLKKDYDPSVYFDLVLGKNLLNQERSELKDALNMMMLEQAMQDGKFADSFREMVDKAKEMSDYKEAKRALPDKKIKKNLYEAIDKK